MSLQLTPQTDGYLTFEIIDIAGHGVDFGSVTADFYNPKGELVATGVVGTHTTGGNWKLPVGAAYSTWQGRALTGEYVARIVALAGGQQVTVKQRYNVDYTDKS